MFFWFRDHKSYRKRAKIRSNRACTSLHGAQYYLVFMLLQRRTKQNDLHFCSRILFLNKTSNYCFASPVERAIFEHACAPLIKSHHLDRLLNPNLNLSLFISKGTY